MGLKKLNKQLVIITKNDDGSKSSKSVYICSHGGGAVGREFIARSEIVFYCPDHHELRGNARVFFMDSGRQFSNKTYRYNSGDTVPDYNLTKAVGNSNTTGFDYADLEAWRKSDVLGSDVVSIRDRAWHSSTVKLSWVIQELNLNGYDYLQIHAFCCRSSSGKAPGWDINTKTCTNANCKYSH